MRKAILIRDLVTGNCPAPSCRVSRCHSAKPKGLIRNLDSRSPIGVGDKLRWNDTNEASFGELDPQRLNREGFTFLEIILVVLVLAIAIVPMVRAFSPGVVSAKTEEETTVFTNQARGTLNRVMALDFDTLNSNQGAGVDLATVFGVAAEAAKESFTFKRENYTPTVAITDASGGAGGLLQLTVTISHIQLTTLKAQY